MYFKLLPSLLLEGVKTPIHIVQLGLGQSLTLKSLSTTHHPPPPQTF